MTGSGAAFIIFATSLWASTVASAQSTATTAEPTVIIPMVVTDSQGAPVRGITSADIAVRVNKAPARIVGMNTSSDSPLRLAVLVDTSGSQRSSRSAPAAINALGLLMPHVLGMEKDRAIVITFGMFPTATDFMNRDQMSRFSMHLTPYGGTALYDAIALACDRLSADSTVPTRRVLIVVTDGDDDASHISLDGTVKVLQRASALMFLIDTGDKHSPSKLEASRHHVYKEFAEKAGSVVYVEHPPEDMPGIVSSIKQQIDSMDVVSCVAAESGKPGHHAIEIEPATHKEWRVHAPQGYDDK